MRRLVRWLLGSGSDEHDYREWLVEVLEWAQDADMLLHKERGGSEEDYEMATTLAEADRFLFK